MITKPWEGYVEPGRIYGNLYFIGTKPSSTHLVDTGAGLAIIDSGYPQNLYLVIAGLYKMGFALPDVKYIIHSHGHYDHLGATRALVALTGAKTVLGAADRDFANGRVDLTWARELGCEYFEAFEPDILVNDGDTLTIGNTRFEFVSTPGHTPGTMSIFFPVSQDGQRLIAGMQGGGGMNSMKRDWLIANGLSLDCRDDFRRGLRRVRDRRVDINIGNHVSGNNTIEKLDALRNGTVKNPFVDPNEWKKLIDRLEHSLDEMLAAEQSHSPDFI